MNKVEINTAEVPPPSWKSRAKRFALKVLKELKRGNWELSILFCDDKTIAELNSRYRNIAQATDILSFSLGETAREGKKNTYLPGDIVISLDILRENAKYFQTSEDEELRRLLIHGILHLDGMEHKTNEKNEPMLELQEEILNKLKDERIISGGEK